MDITALYDLFRQSRGVSTDTRTLKAGELFFTLSGENFDGNRFIEQALEKGAHAVVADGEALPKHPAVYRVPDALRALQELARHHRRQFSIPFIALTGSNGKTTSKELLVSVLAQKYRVHATQGNLNNHIGVPLTLLRLSGTAEIAVIEMGANHVGDIAELCRIAEPTHGAITNIGTAHIEGFGGQMGVLKGKTELYDFLETHHGQIFMPSYDPLLAQKADQYSNIVRWGKPEDFSYYELKESEPSIVYLDEQQQEVKAQLFGAYNFRNIQLALAIGKWFEVPLPAAHHAVAGYTSDNNRSQIIRRDKQTFVLDAYNANPSSMEAALRSFARTPAQERVAILGDMLELGDITAEKHRAIRELALELPIHQVIFCGQHFTEVCLPSDRCFPTPKALKDYLSDNPLPAEAHILLKGSRKVQLEQLVSAY